MNSEILEHSQPPGTVDPDLVATDVPPVDNRVGDWDVPVTITENNFVYKSLSNWACNTAIGCSHSCRACYVPSTATIKQGPALARHGAVDPDAEWGEYVLLRPFDEKKFLASLRVAEKTPRSELKADGNRAVMFCTTTDPCQVIHHADPVRQRELTERSRFLTRRSLELIRDHSTLNVRVLTRSPLARTDFDLYKSFGNRLVFGMSLPTLRNDLAKVYEPKDPAPSQRLATLRAAKKAGLHVFVAMAPTYPECDESDLRRTLAAVAELDPVTVFHEPINIRAENVARIAAHGREVGVTLRTDVFATPETWQDYAISALRTVEAVATELGIQNVLHLWPDKALGAEAVVKRMPNPEGYTEWLHRCWNRLSEWPGVTHLDRAQAATQSAAPTVAADIVALSETDIAYLTDREKIVSDGIKASITAAKALHQIHVYRDGILYHKFPSFAAYCRAKWGYGKAHSYRLVECGDLVIELEKKSPKGDWLPRSESQVRPLLALPKASRVDCWKGITSTIAVETLTGKVVAQRTREYAEAHDIEIRATKKAPRCDQESVTAAMTQLDAAVETLPEAEKIKPLLDEVDVTTVAQPVAVTQPPPAVGVAAAPALVMPPRKSPGQTLDDEIRAAIEHLDELTAKHRRAVQWGSLIAKFSRDAEVLLA